MEVETILEKQFTNVPEPITFDTEGIIPGVYFVKIEDKYSIQTLKVIKTNWSLRRAALLYTTVHLNPEPAIYLI